MTTLAKLVTYDEDCLGYLTYVFKCLDEEVAKMSPYILCTRYPNWQHRKIDIGEEGFLQFREVRAGIDTWYDGDTMIPYKYDAVQFIKFVEIKKDKNNEFIM